MAPEILRPTSLEHIVEFIKDTENDIEEMWIYDKKHQYQYLGSLLPKLKGLDISITDQQQLTMVLYISDDDDVLRKSRLIISDFNDYDFHYL